jgi:hypothetical protein
MNAWFYMRHVHDHGELNGTDFIRDGDEVHIVHVNTELYVVVAR